MLQITGKVLGVSTERVEPKDKAAFDSHTVTLQGDNMPNGRPRIEDVRLGRDVDPDELRECVGESVTLDIWVSAFPRRGEGAGYRLNASRLVAVAGQPLALAG